jgi:mycoredoxin
VKKLWLLIVVMGIAAAWPRLQPLFGPSARSETVVMSASPGEVTLYATQWCGYCKATRQFFDQHQIPYTEYDIEKSEKGRKLYRALGGSGGVPLIEVREHIIYGFDERKLAMALREKRS